MNSPGLIGPDNRWEQSEKLERIYHPRCHPINPRWRLTRSALIRVYSEFFRQPPERPRASCCRRPHVDDFQRWRFASQMVRRWNRLVLLGPRSHDNVGTRERHKDISCGCSTVTISNIIEDFRAGFAVDSDGKRFLIPIAQSSTTSPTFTVVVNWASELRSETHYAVGSVTLPLVGDSKRWSPRTSRLPGRLPVAAGQIVPLQLFFRRDLSHV